MSESVEQAALRRASATDWQGRARREAAAILDETGYDDYVPGGPRNPAELRSRDALISLLGIAWLQGFNLGSHETLTMAEGAFENLRAAL